LDYPNKEKRMPKIENTELEYTDADAIALDYYLGSDCETKDQWAQRVWSKCAEYKATGGMGYDGKGMESVYKRCPYGLWEEKKGRRRAKLMEEFHGKRLNADEQEFLDCCDKEVSRGKRMKWSVSHCDEQVNIVANDERYKTRDQRDAEEILKQEQEQLAKKTEVEQNVALLKAKGFDAQTISVIYPRSRMIKETCKAALQE